jgi:hypothetical protein
MLRTEGSVPASHIQDVFQGSILVNVQHVTWCRAFLQAGDVPNTSQKVLVDENAMGLHPNHPHHPTLISHQ